jgi:hypothetical protein
MLRIKFRPGFANVRFKTIYIVPVRARLAVGTRAQKTKAANTPCRAETVTVKQSAGIPQKAGKAGLDQPRECAFCHSIQLQRTKTDRTDINTSPFSVKTQSFYVNKTVLSICPV